MAEQAKKAKAVSGHGPVDRAPAVRNRERAKYSYKPKPTSFADTVLKRQTRSKRGKPLGIDPLSGERDYDADEVEFMMAMDEYKRTKLRPFPTFSEVLVILKSLGYRKVDAP